MQTVDFAMDSLIGTKIKTLTRSKIRENINARA